MSNPILCEIPESCKALAGPIRAMIDEVAANCRRASGDGAALDYARIEQTLRELAAGVERGANEAVLASVMIDAPAIRVGGAVYSPVCRSKGRYKTQAGVVELERPLYREMGVRNGPTIDPIGVRIGAVLDGWLPGTAIAMAYLMQQGTSREAAKAFNQLGRLPYSRSSFERIPHEVGADLAALRADIEEDLIAAFVVPPEAASVSASIDRVSVPMEEPRARPRGRPAKNAPKNPVSRQFRMAYCATLTLHDESGASIHTIRTGRMPQGDAASLADALGSDVIALREQRPDLEVVRLADGAHEMWNLLESGLDDASLGVTGTSLVDFWHLAEKLSAAAEVLDGDAEERMKRWRHLLLDRIGGASLVLADLRLANPCRPCRADDPVYAAITYIENHVDRMHYARARRMGLPIGSGNVEATCKSLVQLRMKRPGARWKERTGDHVLQLRAIALSDRWDDAMDLVFRQRRQDIRLHAA